MARPTKQINDKRGQWIKARVSPAEHALVLTQAARTGMSSSDYLRRCALSPQLVVPENPAADFELTDQLRRIGVNLNQLTRVANTTGFMPDGLEEALARLDQIFSRMVDQ